MRSGYKLFTIFFGGRRLILRYAHPCRDIAAYTVLPIFAGFSALYFTACASFSFFPVIKGQKKLYDLFRRARRAKR